MDKRKKSLFDSIEMFGRTLPEIFREAGMNDEEIEMFRSRFNDEDPNAFHASALEQFSTTEKGMEELEKHDKISRLKESMKKGFTPPEDQGENVW